MSRLLGHIVRPGAGAGAAHEFGGSTENDEYSINDRAGTVMSLCSPSLYTLFHSHSLLGPDLGEGHINEVENIYTIRPRSLDQFYVENFYIKWIRLLGHAV